MKLVSFRVQTPVGRFVRAGALHGHSIVDLNMACARLLADQHEARPARLANAMVPATMLELLEGGGVGHGQGSSGARARDLARRGRAGPRGRNDRLSS